MTANLFTDLEQLARDQESDLHYCQAILTDIAAAIETLGIPYNLNPEDYADEIRKLKADRDRARQAGERLASSLQVMLDEHGWYHPELPEEGQGSCAACCSARGTLADWRGQQTGEPEGEK